MIIKNIRLINPATDFDDIADISVEDGIIKKIEKSGEAAAEGESVIDGTGLCAAPGLMDVHVHFRDPGFTYKEDIETGAKAAAKGGYTTVILMGNTKPCADNVDTVGYVLDKASKEDINIFTVANVTKGMKGVELTDFDKLSSMGAAGFSDDGIPIMDEELLREAFIKAKELNLPVSLHEEDPSYITNNGVNAGDVAKALGITGSPREAEISMIKRDVQIAAETGADIDIQHISTKEGVEIIREYRKQYKNIHAEATPHHFTLTDDAVLKYGTLAKMNPPLRKEEDRQAIIEGLKDGTIEIIATDHAPHSVEEKAKEITQAPSGILGLETAFSLGITELVDKGYLTVNELIDRMSTGPARLYGMEGTAGSVEEGRKADIIIFDINEKYVVDGYLSKSSNSPFTGWELKGKIKYTICSGKVVYTDGED